MRPSRPRSFTCGRWASNLFRKATPSSRRSGGWRDYQRLAAAASGVVDPESTEMTNVRRRHTITSRIGGLHVGRFDDFKGDATLLIEGDREGIRELAAGL